MALYMLRQIISGVSLPFTVLGTSRKGIKLAWQLVGRMQAVAYCTFRPGQACLIGYQVEPLVWKGISLPVSFSW